MSGNDPFLGARVKPNTSPSPISLLTVGGGALGLEVNNPDALKSVGAGAGEMAQGLPPFRKIPGYRVDDIPAAPTDWARDGDRSGVPVTSYVVGVRPKSGLWFDFNQMAQRHNRHVAVVLSMQGINAVTGNPIEGELALEQYPGARGDETPQNYLASNVTPYPYFWLDGFRTKDGTVRQFFVDEDEARGVAAQKIGSARTFTLGFSIFESLELKPPAPVSRFRGGDFAASASAESFSMSKGVGATRGGGMRSLEIGAGAKIHQRVFRDTQPLTFWNQRPSGIVVLHYVLEDDLRTLLGTVRTGDASEGPLQGIKVGN